MKGEGNIDYIKLIEAFSENGSIPDPILKEKIIKSALALDFIEEDEQGRLSNFSIF